MAASPVLAKEPGVQYIAGYRLTLEQEASRCIDIELDFHNPRPPMGRAQTTQQTEPVLGGSLHTVMSEMKSPVLFVSCTARVTIKHCQPSFQRPGPGEGPSSDNVLDEGPAPLCEWGGLVTGGPVGVPS